MYPRAAWGRLCGGYFLVSMASAMTSHHYLTSHSENPNPLEYLFRVLHILTINMLNKMVDFLIGHYTYRMFPPAIDIIPTLLAVVYSNGKYTN